MKLVIKVTNGNFFVTDLFYYKGRRCMVVYKKSEYGYDFHNGYVEHNRGWLGTEEVTFRGYTFPFVIGPSYSIGPVVGFNSGRDWDTEKTSSRESVKKRLKDAVDSL